MMCQSLIGFIMNIAKAILLKQGLRHVPAPLITKSYPDCKSYSTKTRIATYRGVSPLISDSLLQKLFY